MKKANEEKAEEQGKSGKILHIVGNVIGIVIIAVLLPIMAVNMTLIIKSYTQPEKVPTVLGVAPLIVMSGSMDPTIQVNDLIFTKTVDTKSLQKGDIIAFQPINVTTVVTHRIVDVLDDSKGIHYTTQGDWNGVPDVDPVYPFQVVGLYFQRLPGVGKIALFLQQPIGMVVFVAVPLALFLLYDLLRRFFYNRKHKGEKTVDQEELERLRALAAALEAGEVPAPAAPVFVPAPDIESPPDAPDGEPEAELDEDDDDEV